VTLRCRVRMSPTPPVHIGAALTTPDCTHRDCIFVPRPRNTMPQSRLRAASTAKSPKSSILYRATPALPALSLVCRPCTGRVSSRRSTKRPSRSPSPSDGTAPRMCSITLPTGLVGMFLPLPIIHRPPRTCSATSEKRDAGRRRSCCSSSGRASLPRRRCSPQPAGGCRLAPPDVVGPHANRWPRPLRAGGAD
jgi:hypothetical protein